MAPRSATVVVDLELVDSDPEVGRWCAPCALPSAAVLTFMLILNGTPYGMVRRKLCLDCGDVTDG